jgi:menaquinone-dependent protoporphyrinogen oxidase
MKILVAYASNAGSTAEVAKVVGEELAAGGAAVDVRPVTGLGGSDVAGYDAVVLGGPMILGWHRDAERFLKANHTLLSRVPLALFITAMALTKTDGGAPAGIPLFIDPKLPKAPRNPGRLGLKERYATVGNYLRPVLKAAGGAQPVSVALFGGKLDFGRLKFVQMFFVMLILAAQPGDYRNWDAIRGWARETGAQIAKGK